MSVIPDYLESGEVARLIPVIADSRREQKVASVFLATFPAVPHLAQSLFSSLGIRLGKRALIDTYTEVIFRGQKEVKGRPDGLVVITTGKNQWRALLEAKIRNSPLEAEQVERYLNIARDYDVDAVITVSNQFVARPEHNPISVSKSLTKHVKLYHWSWKFVLTEAILLQASEAVTDPDQAFMLREFVRFLSHDSVGVSGFTRMPATWKDVVVMVKSGASIRKSANETEEVVSAWHQETRDLGLRLSQHLVTSVSVRLPKAQVQDLGKRLEDDCRKLSAKQNLEVEYVIPNAASVLHVVADLKTHTIRAGMTVKAPADLKKAASRVNWLLRQLRHTDPTNVFVRVVGPSKAQCSLADLREDIDIVLKDGGTPPSGFEVFSVFDDTHRFAGPKTFIESLERAVPEFYDGVGQHLQNWIPKAPQPISSTPPTGELLPDAAPAVSDTIPIALPAKVEAPGPGNQHSALLELPPYLRSFKG